jgi:hypothetical protein
MAVRVAVHQPLLDSTQATSLDSALDLSCTNSTQAYSVDEEHQPTDLVLCRSSLLKLGRSAAPHQEREEWTVDQTCNAKLW